MKKFMISTIFVSTLLLTPKVADAALGDQTLRIGMRDNDVTELQELLKREGLLRGGVDGIFGPQTKQSVKDFQARKGLTVDGIAGPQTFSAMNVRSSSAASSPSSSNSSSSNSVQQSSSSSNSFSSTLRQGMRGSEVSSLQSALKDKGFLQGSVDGVFGPLTAQSVRNFQRSAGIAVDGIAGPQTFNALGSSIVSNSSSNSNSSSSAASNTSASNRQSSGSSTIESTIRTAQSLTGTPYVWGGTTPRGFDCSGFIQYAFKQHGVNLPRTVAQMYNQLTRVSSPQRGDIVFFNTSSGPSHAGIYLGNGQFIHSGASTGVIIASMSNSYWAPRYLGAARVN